MTTTEMTKPQQQQSSEVDPEKARYDLSVREAMALAKSSWTPAHLIGKTEAETQATCVGVVVMSRKWGFSPSMVAGETYSVKGKLGFQGKLYAAVANAHGGLSGGLRAIYHGIGDKMACVVFGSTGTLNDVDKDALRKLLKANDPDAATELELNGVKAIRVTVGQCKTDQKMWTNDPEQKLYYTGSTKWCRRFIPDLVLGAVSVEDIERINYIDAQSVTQVKNEPIRIVDNRSNGKQTILPIPDSHELEPIHIDNGTSVDDSYAKAAKAREERLAQEAKSQAEAEAKYPVGDA